MTENSLINSGFLVLRPLIEVTAQLRYIIMDKDKDKVKERATILQMLDIKRTAVDETAFYNSMNNQECYKMKKNILSGIVIVKEKKLL